ncbi:hypothetical protein [Flavihumibacter profundi]|uniref:hypothetical protein n=1 Tax=Flavihumibacter profundi TaxID=2716883 RepID=UPI001CC7E571|nr:hypothetical protein [Flavihumibacter profundi]MBZ5859372.1 hypothetical protein [Flavihumibacter profundi]
MKNARLSFLKTGNCLSVLQHSRKLRQQNPKINEYIVISDMKSLQNVLSAVLLLISSWAMAQNTRSSLVAKVADEFMGSIRKSDKEQIFVQTDKSFYTTGEDIWLKAFCIGAISNKPFQESQSLFADLVNDHDSVISQIMLNNSSGNLNGRISIPVTLPEGYYWLRAYTERQAQEDQQSIYVQSLYFFNASQKKSNPPGSIKGKVIVQPSDTGVGRIKVNIYPEGGVVIAGSTTLFTITATDNQGKPVDVSGYISNSANGVVAKYRTGEYGLGTFSFYARSPMQYSAHTNYGAGKELLTPLPKPDLSGYQLSVTSQTSDSVFCLVSLGDSIYKKYKLSFVLALQRDSLCYAAAGEDMYKFAIPVKKLPAGKINLLLFNDEHKIVSQRDIYIGKPNTKLTITPDRPAYSPRQKVILDIGNYDTSGKKDPAIYSVAATRKNMAVNNNSTIAFNRIRNGGIEFPNNRIADSAINTNSFRLWDTVMLAQTGHYLGWEKKKDSSTTSVSSAEMNNKWKIISGRIVSKGQKGKKRQITLFYNSGRNNIETEVIEENGQFKFNLPDLFIDSTLLNLQVSTTNGISSEDSIIIDTLHFPKFSTPLALKERLPESAILKMDSIITARFSGSEWLKPVTVTARDKEQVTYNASKIISPFSRIIPGDKLGQSQNAIETALLKTPGVTVVDQRIKIMGGGIQSKTSKAAGPLLFLDGIPVNVNNKANDESSNSINLDSGKDPLLIYLESINPRFIDFIEVIEGSDAAIFGLGTDGGVIYVHTLSTFREELKQNEKGHKSFYARGYSIAPVFLIPDYDKIEIKQSSYPDRRTTVYWNGNIETGNHQQVTVRFFTADDPTDYLVSVIMLTNTGDIQLANCTITCK